MILISTGCVTDNEEGSTPPPREVARPMEGNGTAEIEGRAALRLAAPRRRRSDGANPPTTSGLELL